MISEPFSFPLLIGRIPPSGGSFHVAPGDAERSAIAEALGIVSVDKLTADLDVRPVGAEAFAVRGRLQASVVQTDVVTLEPVTQEVAEEIDVTLLPAENMSDRESADHPSAADDRDLYHGGRIDLGAILVEHLALGLDPYPRSPGVEFSGHIEDKPDAGESPFSVLARLKPKGE
jgi:hypothetical protein